MDLVHDGEVVGVLRFSEAAMGSRVICPALSDHVSPILYNVRR